MNYRIYQNIVGWEYVTTTTEKYLNKAINCLNGETHILIVRHHIKDDYDEPCYVGYVKDYKIESKKKVKRYGQ